MNPPAPPTHPPSSSGSWLKTHQKQAALAGGGLVLAYALYKRNQSSNGSAPASSLLGGSSTGTVSGAYPYSSTQLDQYDQLASAISQLNGQVQAIQASNPGAAAGTTPPAGGTGMPTPGAPIPAPTGTVGWNPISTPAQGSTLLSQGATIGYTEPGDTTVTPWYVGGHQVAPNPAPGGTQYSYQGTGGGFQGWTPVATPGEGSMLLAHGATIGYTEPGATSVTPWNVGGHQIAPNPAPGGTEWVKVTP